MNIQYIHRDLVIKILESVGAFWVENDIYDHLPEIQKQEIYKRRDIDDGTLDDIFCDIEGHERFTALQLYCTCKSFDWIKNLTFISGLRNYEILPRSYESFDLFGKYVGLSLNMYYSNNYEPQCMGYYYSNVGVTQTCVVYGEIIYIGNKEYDSSEYFIDDFDHVGTVFPQNYKIFS
jgi:hypothetical protein